MSSFCAVPRHNSLIFTPALYAVGSGSGHTTATALASALARGLNPTAARCSTHSIAGGGGFRREVQPRRQHWFLNEKSGFSFRTPAFFSVSRGQRRLGEEEYRAPSVTPGVALRPRTQGVPRMWLTPPLAISPVGTDEEPQTQAGRSVHVDDVGMLLGELA